MKYVPHGLEYLGKKYSSLNRLNTFFALAIALVFGSCAYRLFTEQLYYELILVVLLIALFYATRFYAVRAERFKRFMYYSHYAKPQILNFSKQGFHFEEGVSYRATLLREILKKDGAKDYMYLIEKISTEDSYVVTTFMELPKETFRWSYDEKKWYLHIEESTVH